MNLVCDWNAWERYLVQVLTEGSEPLLLNASEDADTLLARVQRHAAPADMVLFNVNLSFPERLPRDRASVVTALEARGFTVWNGRIQDITKRAVHEMNRRLGLPCTLAPREGAREERVMVKNNFNAHGRPEKLLRPEERELLGYPPYAPSPIVNFPEYPVLPRELVPADWWTSPDLVIERFVDNRLGLFFRVYFVGYRVSVSHGRATNTVRRINECEDRVDYLVSRPFLDDPQLAPLLPEPSASVLRAARTMADAFCLDYGAVDLVLDEQGLPYVVDVNPTPYWGPVSEGEEEFLQHLREGLTEDRPLYSPVSP